MRGTELLDKMGLIDPVYVDAADCGVEKKNRVWVKLGAIAACVCIILVGVFGLFNGSQKNTLQKWNNKYKAEDYFKFCGIEDQEGFLSAGSFDVSAIPYDEVRFFSDMRKNLEESGAIPVIETHPQFTLTAYYNKDGSLYCVELLWGRRSIDGTKEYSDLKVIAGYDEVQVINDCIVIEMDEKGDIIEPAVTVTEREGVQIVARGRENTEKTLTFRNENGWYQVSGSWNDSYEPVAELLDWFWENPLDFELFSMADGDNYTYTSLSETMNAFGEYLPDFASFGFVEEGTIVILKNGIPVQFEGHYVAHADEELVKKQAYYNIEGHTKMHWCIYAEPDVYDLAGCLGDISTLNREKIAHILENEDNKVKFMQDDLLIIVYPDNADEVWALIESLVPN